MQHFVRQCGKVACLIEIPGDGTGALSARALGGCTFTLQTKLNDFYTKIRKVTQLLKQIGIRGALTLLKKYKK